MKKIISALTVGAMIATAAFADVTIGLSYKQRANLFAHDFEQGDPNNGGKKAQSKILNLDAYSGAGSDALSFGILTDLVTLNIGLETKESNQSNIRAKKLNATVTMPIKGLQVFGGLWADGKLDGSYRNSGNAGNLEGMDFEYKKMGSIFKNSPAHFVDNIVNPVDQDQESFALGAEYKINKYATTQIAYSTNTNSEKKSANAGGMLQGHTIAALGKFVLPFGKAEVVAKYGAYTADTSAMAFAAYCLPTIPLDGFKTSVGGSFALIDFKPSDWSADLRIEYTVSKKLSFSSFHAISGIIDPEGMKLKTTTDKDGKTTYGNVSTKGIADSGSISGNGKHGGTAMNRDMVFSNNLLAKYQFNSKVSVFGVIADMVGMGKHLGADVTGKDGKTDPVEVQLRASLWGQFNCGKSAIAVGVVYSAYDVGSNLKENGQFSAMSIPVIFRCRF